MKLNSVSRRNPRDGNAAAFTRTDLLVVIAVVAVLAAIVTIPLAATRRKASLVTCLDNLQKVNRAVLAFAEDRQGVLPPMSTTPHQDVWWWYKELVKSYAGLTGPPSTNEQLFACPGDRGYSDPKPFHRNPRFAYGSYVFNGVTLPGVPNIAGWKVASLAQPRRTLLTMEWAAHGPLSWHSSRTGKANAPFYNDAQSVVAFADGHVSFSEMFHDGYNAAYTRDPIAGYDYRYSGR